MYAGLHTYSFRKKLKAYPDFDIYDALDATAEMGFKAVELLIGNPAKKPWEESRMPDFEPSTVKKATDYARRRGIDALSYSTYNDFAAKEDELFERHVQFILDWIDHAANNGVPNIRFLTGYYREGEDPEWKEARTLQGIERVVPAALERKVNLSTENHNSIFFSADDLLMLIDKFGNPPITGCPDPSNWAKGSLSLDPGIDREPIYENLAKLAPHATQSHLKLKGIDESGEGFIGFDLKRLLRIYRDAGYRGALCFESVVYGKDEEGDLTEILPQAREVLEKAIADVLREKPDA